MGKNGENTRFGSCTSLIECDPTPLSVRGGNFKIAIGYGEMESILGRTSPLEHKLDNEIRKLGVSFHEQENQRLHLESNLHKYTAVPISQ